MLKIVGAFMAILYVAYIAFVWGYIRGCEDRSDFMNWGTGWDDGYEAGKKAERTRQCREELRKNLGMDGGE